jgi:hypothetical protein
VNSPQSGVGLLRELVPSATSIAALVNPTRAGADAQSAQGKTLSSQARAADLPVSLKFL